MSFLKGGRVVSSRVAAACVLYLHCVLGDQLYEDHRYLSLYEGDACQQHRTGAVGVCTHLAKCPSATLDIINGLKPTTCAYKGTWAVVCCSGDGTPPRSPSDIVDLSTTLPSTAAPLQVTAPPILTKIAPSRPADIKCEEYKLPKPPAAAYAVGGILALAFEFPHMAALGWRETSGSIVFLCGGSLISERFVLTVAHCLVAPRHYELTDESPGMVRLGVIYVNKTLAPAEGQLDVLVKNHIPHPSYKPPAKYFDIALLELAEVVPFNKHHRPACLWTRQDFEPHTKATITGWGTTTNRGRDNSPGLMKVVVDLLDSGLCDKLLVSSRSRNWEGFQEHQLCAGELAGGKDACQGDSGGPLQVIIDSVPKNHYSLIGLTSFGRECALPNQPGIYTRVSSFVDWIEDIVWPEYKQNATQSK